jgi:ABC-type branched-subunit amino acid transport system permease subunit
LLAFYCALGQAFNLFMGMTGYVDFGYVAFLGIGTYGMAIAISRFSDKGWGLGLLVVGLLMAIGMATLLALAVGAVALRLRGAYFAIATIGVNEGLRYLKGLRQRFVHVLGGRDAVSHCRVRSLHDPFLHEEQDRLRVDGAPRG